MARLRLLLLTLAALTAGNPAQGEDKYPSRPIKVVVPFGPGSATDIVIRIVGEAMRPILGQAVLVENKPGAFGIIAIEEMARGRPDGYTLEIGNSGTNALAPILYKKKFRIDYDKDVTLVTALSEIPLVLAATTKDFPPTNYAEFIAYAKAHPGEVRYASVGTGSNNHYDTEAFAKWAGIELVHLPNKGGGGAMTNDLLTGNAHIAFVNAASALGVIQAGEVRGWRSCQTGVCGNCQACRPCASSAIPTQRACGRPCMRLQLLRAMFSRPFSGPRRKRCGPKACTVRLQNK
jgi:tripartite-type tricarboxylate transporter receptor subunit TctC